MWFLRPQRKDTGGENATAGATPGLVAPDAMRSERRRALPPGALEVPTPAHRRRGLSPATARRAPGVAAPGVGECAVSDTEAEEMEEALRGLGYIE